MVSEACVSRCCKGKTQSAAGAFPFLPLRCNETAPESCRTAARLSIFFMKDLPSFCSRFPGNTALILLYGRCGSCNLRSKPSETRLRMQLQKPSCQEETRLRMQSSVAVLLVDSATEPTQYPRQTQKTSTCREKWPRRKMAGACARAPSLGCIRRNRSLTTDRSTRCMQGTGTAYFLSHDTSS